MENRFPLSTLLSQTLVAFIIEFDNEFEHRIPHRTSDHGISSHGDGLWLASMVMWENCMRHIGDEDRTKAQVEALALTPTNWDGMRRWGYVQLIDPPRGTSKQAGTIVRATAAGKRAQSVWRPLTAEISERWHTRFGADLIQRLSAALQQMEHKMGLFLPDCLPILKYGLFTRVKVKAANGPEKAAGDPPDNPPAHSLPALLSKILLAFALHYERNNDLSLAIAADVLRPLTEDGIPLRDIGRLTGVSKESVAMAMGVLKKGGWVIEGSAAKGRGKAVGLTGKGLAAHQFYINSMAGIEDHWQKVFGAGTIDLVRSSLETLVGDGSPNKSPLFRGLIPYPDGWRSKVPKPETLPYFPMVLHRGGFPDGS